MNRHLAKCLDSVKQEKRKSAFHLLVEGGKIYWLHLAMSTAAPLSKLDQFLRDIWLECCGHMSGFHIGTSRYSSQPMDDGLGGANYREKSTTVAAHKVFEVGSKFSYEYDYGSTTELSLKVLGLGEYPISAAVELLARNNPPEILCDNCGVGTSATQVCTSCIWSGEGWLCDECVTTHKCGEEMTLPVVNSPRTGVCGYTG